jgi:hypothetical protein
MNERYDIDLFVWNIWWLCPWWWYFGVRLIVVGNLPSKFVGIHVLAESTRLWRHDSSDLIIILRWKLNLIEPPLIHWLTEILTHGMCPHHHPDLSSSWKEWNVKCWIFEEPKSTYTKIYVLPTNNGCCLADAIIIYHLTPKNIITSIGRRRKHLSSKSAVIGVVTLCRLLQWDPKRQRQSLQFVESLNLG